MSGFAGPPPGGMGLAPPPGPPQGAPPNVVPFPQQPAMAPNPAFQAWMQQAQQVRAINAENAKRQGQFDAAVALIKKDGIHGFKLDIEADSTIAPDEQSEKANRIEFMQQFIPLMEQVVPMAQGNPALASLAKEAVLFAVRGFPAARTMEEAIETAFDQIAKMPPNPKFTGQGKDGGTHQNPAIEAAKVQADVQDTQTKARADMAAIAQKEQAAVLAAQTAGAKIAAENERSQAQLGLQASEMAQRERLDVARMQHMAARDAGGLI